MNRRMITASLLILIAILVTACAPSNKAIQTAIALTPSSTAYPTHTAYPSHTPYPTYTIPPTYTAVIKIKIVTKTSTPTPIYTPTETLIPTETSTITPTKDPLTTDKNSGFYLVGVKIAPGLWKSNGTGNRCYWAVTTKTGDIIKNHYGMGGGTAYIPATGFQVEFNDCGTWTYLGP